MPLMSDITSSGALPALEMTIRFAGQRQRIIAHNIANLTTPDFRPADVSPQAFQSALSEAIDDRRARTAGQGELHLPQTREIRQRMSPSGGQLVLRPRTPASGVLAHDRNNADLERLMQDLAENTAVFRTAVDLLRSRGELIKGAIAQRV